MTRRSVIPRLLTVVTVMALVESIAITAAADESSHAPGTSALMQTTITVHTDGRLGPYITDGRGRPLYSREPRQDGDECVERCAEIWPPVVVNEAQSVAGNPLVQADLIGHMRRLDGRQQVTYGSNPLFYYALDEQRAGADARGEADALGQGVHDEWGSWFLVDPDGRRVEGLLDPR